MGMENANELKAGFKRNVPSDDDDSTGMTGASGSTGITGFDNTGATGGTGATGNGNTGAAGPTLDDDGLDLSPAEKLVEEKMERDADKKLSRLDSEKQVEQEISSEVGESKS